MSFLPGKGAANFFSILQGAMNQKRLKNTALGGWLQTFFRPVIFQFPIAIAVHLSVSNLGMPYPAIHNAHGRDMSNAKGPDFNYIYFRLE